MKDLYKVKCNHKKNPISRSVLVLADSSADAEEKAKKEFYNGADENYYFWGIYLMSLEQFLKEERVLL